MNKVLTPADCMRLSWIDPDWPTKKFEELLDIPGFYGIYNQYAFVVGICCEDLITIERMYFLDDEPTAKDELFEALISEFGIIRTPAYDLSTREGDRAILAWLDLGFEPEVGFAPMKCRCLLTK